MSIRRLSNSCPRIMQVDSEFEFWDSEASLLVTDTRGRNLEPPPEVRLYMIAGMPHGNVASAVVPRKAACTLPLNPVYGGPAYRALLTDLRAWITEGVAPPASRCPTLAQNTLVASADVYPVPIPGLDYHAQYPRADTIEQAAPLPKVLGQYPVHLPRAGADGNALAGIRLPHPGRPVPPGIRSPAPTAHRPSVPRWEAPFPNVAAVKAAVARMVDDRLLLPEDAADAVAAAQAGMLARLAP